MWLRLTDDMGRAIHSIASFDGRAVGFREPFAQAEQRRRQQWRLRSVSGAAHRLASSPRGSPDKPSRRIGSQIYMFQEAGRGRGWVVSADAHVEEYNGL